MSARDNASREGGNQSVGKVKAGLEHLEPRDLESFLTHVDLSVEVQPWQLPFFEFMERMRPEDRLVIRHGRKRSWLEVGKGS